MSLSFPKPICPVLHWSGLSNQGKRLNNEDAFLGLQFDAHEIRRLGKNGSADLSSADFLFAVSDGIGGAQSGEFASRIAVEKITRLLPKAFRRRAQGFSAGIEDIFGELFTDIHKALLFLGSSYEECAEMGATLTLAWFSPGWMHFAHIGDSRLYYFPAGGGIRQLSEDDTHVGWLLRNGKLTEREARQHPRKHFLQRALGAGHQFVLPQVGSVTCDPGDQFLLCTDGLVDGFFDAQLLSELRDQPQDRPSAPASAPPAERMVLESVNRSGRDNTTAVVIQVDFPTPH